MRCVVFFFKRKTAYELRISDWSSDVCSSDLVQDAVFDRTVADRVSAIRDTVVRDLGATLTEPPMRRADGHAVDMHLPVFLAFAAASILVAPSVAGQVVAAPIFLIALALGFLRPPVGFEQRLPLRWRVAAGVLLVAVGAVARVAPSRNPRARCSPAAQHRSPTRRQPNIE